MLDKILIVYHVPGSAARIKKLIDSLDSAVDNRVSVVAFNNTEEELKETGIVYQSAVSYLSAEDYQQAESEAVALVKSLGSNRLEDGRTLIELLEYEHTSLWWFIEANLYRYHVKQVVRYAATLANIVAREEPKKIIFVDDGSMLAGIIAAAGEAGSIPLQRLSSGLRWRLRRTWWLFYRGLAPWAIAQFRGVRKRWRHQLWHLAVRRQSTNLGQEARRKILVASLGRERVIVDPATQEKRLEDSTLDLLVRELEKDETNEIIFLYKSLGPFKLRPPKEAFSGRILYRPWEYYLTSRVNPAVSARAKIIREAWAQLKDSHSFVRLFTYKGINLWDVCRHELEQMFLFQVPRVVEYIELSKATLEIEQPSIVIIASEISVDNKALVTAANLEGIPVMAVQHGAIAAADDYLIDFRSTQEELNGKISKKVTFPQKLAVYGESSRKVLVAEIGYPFPERIIITGQPQYDELARAGEKFSREEFCARRGIDPAKKIALIGSQTFHIAGNKDEFFRNIYQALKNEPNIQVVVKPHPSEKGGEFKELAREVGINAIALQHRSNTHEALYACDVLITFYSTIALEAMILGKPVITVNLTNRPDPVPYASSGAALGVYRVEDIAPAVNKALTDIEINRKLEEGRKKYLYQQFYELDGQATKRVVDLINNMARRQL